MCFCCKFVWVLFLVVNKHRIKNYGIIFIVSLATTSVETILYLLEELAQGCWSNLKSTVWPKYDNCRFAGYKRLVFYASSNFWYGEKLRCKVSEGNFWDCQYFQLLVVNPVGITVLYRTLKIQESFYSYADQCWFRIKSYIECYLSSSIRINLVKINFSFLVEVCHVPRCYDHKDAMRLSRYISTLVFKLFKATLN